MPNPAVSIIIPVFNAQEVLSETVGSVLAQSYEDWELILADDGSTDGSQELARKCAAQGSRRIRCWEHSDKKNHGPLPTRIAAAQTANSDLIALLDADDLWNPEYLEQHLEIWDSLASQNIGLSYGPSLYWYPDPSLPGEGFVQPMPSPGLKVYAPGEILSSFLDSDFATTPCPSCVLIRREALEGARRFEEAAVGLCEDQCIWWHAAARWPVAQHPHVLARYRRHCKSAGAQVAAKSRRDAEILFLRLIEQDLSEACPEHPLLANGNITKRLRALDVQRAGAALQGISPNTYAFLRHAYRMTRKMLTT